MKEKREFLYNLLPAIYRQRDLEMGEPLRGLMAVMEKEMRSLESDIDNLYDNWFIETCEEWVVPYIGDLLGVSVLRSISPNSFSQRAFVANTLAYRRRKGSSFVLEQLAKDATGWPARSVEFFQLLATNQNLNHVRLSSPLTPDLRDTSKLELLGSPFDTTAHILSLGGVSGGRYNINKIGLFLWRIQSYFVIKGTAYHHKDGLYWFNPLGIDAPLFNRPRLEREITHLAEAVNVPGKLHRWALYEDLEKYRNSIDGDNKHHSLYFSKDDGSVFDIFLEDEMHAISPEEILICDLGGYEGPDWIPPTPSEAKYRVAVDPERGRLTLLEDNISGRKEAHPKVQVSYSYGFSADIGGGPYDRQDSLHEWLDSPVWCDGQEGQLIQIQEVSHDKKSLKCALKDWKSYATSKNGHAVGVIVITDSGSYDITSIEMPAGSKLAIVAANLLKSEGRSLADRLDTDCLRPHIKGDFSVNSAKAEGSSEGLSELVLDGLLIEGKLEIPEGDLERLSLFHSTLVPDSGGLVVQSQKNIMGIDIHSCICGPIRTENTFLNLVISDSIIDGLGDDAIIADDAELILQTSTIFGATNVLSLEAENSIFTEMVTAKRRQAGCVRFCYAPLESQTPRRYRCHPELSLKEIDDPHKKKNVLKGLKPSFTSEHYGNPGYAQLSQTTPEGIRVGAEDGLEMGVFNILKQSLREDNLRNCMDEYLRFGQEPKMFYVD